MNILQYREETKRTLPDLSSTLLNSLHMTVGIMTELGEIAEAFSEPSEGGLDIVNLKEEIADASWYLANYANIHNLVFPEVTEQDLIVFEDEWTFGKILSYGGKLLDFDKKLLAYGKVIDEDKRKDVFNNLYLYILLFCKLYDINIEEGYDRNIAKLRLRFPDKFDAEKAINRDTTAERVVLEGK